MASIATRIDFTSDVLDRDRYPTEFVTLDLFVHQL